MAPQASAAPDSFGLLAFNTFGVGNLLPWNCVLAAFDFFLGAYGSFGWAVVCAQAYSVTNMIGNFLMVLYGDKLPLNLQFLLGFSLNGLAVVLLPLFAAAAPQQMWGFISSCLCLVALGIASAVTGAATFGSAGMLSGQHTGAVMFGQGVAGLISLVLQVVCKLALPETQEGNTAASLIFFSICGVYQLVCVGFYFAMQRVPEIKAVVAKQQQAIAPAPNGKLKEPLLDHAEKGHVHQRHPHPPPTHLVDSAPPSGATEAEAELPDTPASHGARPLMAILRDASPQMANVFFVFVGTFLCFPGLALSLKPDGRSGISKEWLPLCIVGVFQIFDFLGRYMPSVKKLPPNKVAFAVALRFLLVPLFMMAQRLPTDEIWGWNVTHFALTALLALSNGWLASLAMMYGPDQVAAPSEKGTVGASMLLSLVSGISVGSFAAALTQIGL